MAIKSASGKYVIFVDSDDTLKKNSLKDISEILHNDEVDLLVALNLTEKEKKVYSNKLNDNNKICSKKDFDNFPDEVDCPIADQLEEKGLYLPSSSHLKKNEIKLIVKQILAIKKNI